MYSQNKTKQKRMYLIISRGCIIIIYYFLKYIQQINNASFFSMIEKGKKNQSSLMNCLAPLAQSFNYLSISEFM